MRKYVRNIAAFFMCLILFAEQGIVSLAAENQETGGEILVNSGVQVGPEFDLSGYEYTETVDLGNGLTCIVYEAVPGISAQSTNVNGETTFALIYNGVTMGYLTQKTTWSCDGVNRPTYVTASNRFDSTDPGNHYLSYISSGTSAYGVSSTRFATQASAYYNSTYIGIVEFATMCDKDGRLSYMITGL